MGKDSASTVETEYFIDIEGYDFGFLYGKRASEFSNKTMLTLYGHRKHVDEDTRAEIEIRQDPFENAREPEGLAQASEEPGIIGFIYIQSEGRFLKMEITLTRSAISVITNALFGKRRLTLRVFAGETNGGPWSLDWPYAEIHAIWLQSFQVSE